jgi:hypothetical protein
MKKVLIVTSQQSGIIGQTLEQIVRLFGYEGALCLHENALATLLSDNFSHVIVLDYGEYKTKADGGFATWRDLQASASGEKMVRVGFDSHDYPDYIKMPCNLPELIEKLGLNK